MGLALVENVPESPETLAEWSFSHMAHHRDVNRAIYQKYGYALPEYVLDPFDPRNPGTWLYQHQIMHQNNDAILGISGYNLLEVDWGDPGQREVWINLNFNEHFQWNQDLGV